MFVTTLPTVSVMWGQERHKEKPALNQVKQGKGKAIPLQVWIGSEGSRRLRLPDYKTIGT
jgi:hypothetical protein